MRRAFVAGLFAVLAGCSYGAGPDKRTDFVLLFNGPEAGLDKEAIAIIDSAAIDARAAPGLDVTVAGYDDSPRTPESNQILSRIRAQTVADALVARGVRRFRIHLTPRRGIGADPGRESRRVEIRIGT